MTYAPKATAAFDNLLAALTEARDAYVLSQERHRDELEAVEGFPYLAHLLSEATDLLLEADRERPRFTSMVSPSRKYLGDNPDALYNQALIRGDRSYRIKGRRRGQSYISFTVHGPDPNGGINGPVLADVNDSALDFGPDGEFELILSADEHPGNWVKLAPTAKVVIVRNYYLRRASIQKDAAAFVEIEIEPLEDPGPAPALDDATVASRLEEVAAFVRANTIGTRVFGATGTAPFVANQPNDVGTPWSFRNAGVDAAGAVDIYYSSGSFDLGPDEALVMEGSVPPSRFTNVVLWNVHMQTLDYRSHRCSLNTDQIVTDKDGRYRIVVSATDPGVPNWLDTCGHRRGTIFWRFLLPENEPEKPQCQVVHVRSLHST